MRPDYLNPFFASLVSIKGVGAKVLKVFARLLRGDPQADVRRIDLLLHMPVSYVDRSLKEDIADIPDGTIVSLRVFVDRHIPSSPRYKRVPYRIETHLEDGESVLLTYFFVRGNYLSKQIPEDSVRYVSGRLERYQGKAQIAHPDYVVSEAEFDGLPMVEPIYPLTAGLSNKQLHKVILACLEDLVPLREWLDSSLLRREGWLSFTDSLLMLHKPEDVADLEDCSTSWRRLAYDECLASQLALALVRGNVKKSQGIARPFEGRLKEDLLAALPFALTNSQLSAIADIEEDLALPERMLRLVQGDVGSGKTMVALIAAADVIESGAQAAMMAPTDLLARQHYASLKPFCDCVGIRLGILTGKDGQKKRRGLLEALEAGDIDFLVGTHAIFQQSVTFSNLGLAIIDEQHRFGVHQRLSLSSKGGATDLLVMTATPIPRTLVLTHYGDMDVSLLTEKPAGRKPIETRVMSLEKLDVLVSRLAQALEKGAKCYWVCPLVEESELLDATSAENRFASLKAVFGDRVQLIHGRMSADEKKQAMDSFVHGVAQILVATTVIEVGVDVPEASIMVIEHSERFGLAQLHQLRGRVGRGSAASSCILLYKGPLGPIAKERLTMMRETEDGFKIAEADLRLRGEGDLLGTKQSGMPGFRIANPVSHLDLMEIARKEARLIVETDPSLSGPRGAVLRDLLYLFGRDEAIQLLKAG